MVENLTFIQSERENDAEFHLIIAQKWRRFGEPKLLHSPLVYSALEYRLSIERLVFELYVFIKRIKVLTEDEEKKLQKLTNVISSIMEVVENNKYLYRILKFHSILYRDDSHTVGVLAVPDISKLKNYWHSLSDYCHMIINPSVSWKSGTYIKRGYELLNEIEDYLWELKVRKYFGFYRMETWQPEVISLAEDFINSKIDEESVRIRLNLMKPVIISRFRKRI